MACKRPIFMHRMGQKVPCGKCEECDRRYVNTWVFRLILESKEYPPDQVTFLTCTYNDENLPETTKEAKRQFQLFMKRLRLYSGIKLRFAASLERGDLHGRFHWHVILFGIPYQREVKTWLEKTWSNGFIDWRPANEKTIRYVLKYVLKSKMAKRTQESSQPGSALTGCWLMSRRPGLGSTRLPDIAKTLDLLSRKSVTALHGYKSAILTPWKSKPVSALRHGNILYPLHRYLQERLRVRALAPSLPPGSVIRYINNTWWIDTESNPTANDDEKK